MTPLGQVTRDPRIAAAEQAAENKPTAVPNQEQPSLIERAIPAEGTAEHQQYVLELIDRIKKLEETSTTNVGFGGLPRVLGLRVSPKGAVSVYGLNANFPTTLYPEQWARLFEQSDRVKKFIESNKDVLTFKDDDMQSRQRKEDLRTKAGIVARQPLRRAA